MAQTRPPDEMIVSDDASDDHTVEILSCFKDRATFPVKVVVNSKRIGVCRNFENAIRSCSKDVIFLADQDDVWLPTKIARMLPVFDAHPRCGYVFSNADLVDKDGKSLRRDLWSSIGFTRSQQLQYARGRQLQVMLRRFSLVTGMTMAMRAAVASQLMPFECRAPRATVHDGWISLMSTAIGAYGVAIPESLVKYRQHGKQLLSAGKPLGFLELAGKKRSFDNEMNLNFANLLDQLAARLQPMEQNNESVHAAGRQLHEKATHIRARVHANNSAGLERIKTVFFEAISGRYGRYSRSFRSIAKDLITD